MSTRFERNLYFLVTGKTPPRSPRKKARRGPPRDKTYLAWIRTLRCCACGTTRGIEAAHVGHDGGKGQKCSDYATVPLCWQCHRSGPHSFHGLNGGAKSFAKIHCLDFDALVQKYKGIYYALNNIQASVVEQARAAEVAVSYPAVEASGAGVESTI